MANEALTADELTSFKTAVGYAIEGWDAGSRTVTYHTIPTSTFNVTAGTTTETGSGSGSIKALRFEFATKHGASQEEAGRVGYLVTKAALAALSPTVTEPRRQDRIVDGSDTYEVLDYLDDPLQSFWYLSCGKAATP